ncbi:MAG: pyrroline-5-carboxylate reductase [Pseudomonadota bacterium]
MTTVTFIGGGNMARALATGLLGDDAAGLTLRAADPDAGQRDALAALGVTTFADNALAADGADALVLAVKPQILMPVIAALPALPAPLLVISIAAGIPIQAISDACASRREAPASAQAVVRCMPNTPALLRAGVTGLFANEAVSAPQRALAEQILGAVGSVHWVPAEAQLDAVTAVSGSGPAYFFYLLEAMIEAGTALGLTPALARALATQTALGAARMATETDTDPATLRHNVTSPGGTTEAAIRALEDAGVADSVGGALHRAAARAQEMAKEFSQ